MVKRIVILIMFVVVAGLASSFNECEKQINKSPNWTLLYNKNKEIINSISKCVFGNINKRVLELYDFNNSENYATLYIAGSIDDYEENENQYLKDDSIYTNFSCELKKKKKITQGKNGGFDLSQITWGSTGFDLLFQDDSIAAIRIHGDGEHRTSISFIDRIKSCSIEHKIKLEKEFIHHEK